MECFLHEAEIDWFELCHKCLQKKYKDLDKLQSDLKLKQKAVNYLLYNGFNFDEINFAISGEI